MDEKLSFDLNQLVTNDPLQIIKLEINVPRKSFYVSLFEAYAHNCICESLTAPQSSSILSGGHGSSSIIINGDDFTATFIDNELTEMVSISYKPQHSGLVNKIRILVDTFALLGSKGYIPSEQKKFISTEVDCFHSNFTTLTIHKGANERYLTFNNENKYFYFITK